MAASIDGDFHVSLLDILNGDPAAIRGVRDGWQQRGYVFVKLTDELIEQRDLLTKDVLRFFEGSPLSEKEKLAHGRAFGWVNAGSRESFRILSGQRKDEFQFPAGIADLNGLIDLTDQTMIQLFKVLSFGGVFGTACAEDPYQVAETLKLPLLYRPDSGLPRSFGIDRKSVV